MPRRSSASASSGEGFSTKRATRDSPRQSPRIDSPGSIHPYCPSARVGSTPRRATTLVCASTTPTAAWAYSMNAESLETQWSDGRITTGAFGVSPAMRRRA